jgi:hypothetical protein
VSSLKDIQLFRYISYIPNTRNKSFDKLYVLSAPFWCQMEKFSGNLFLIIWGSPPINVRYESLQMITKTVFVPPVNLRSESASIIWMELKYFLKDIQLFRYKFSGNLFLIIWGSPPINVRYESLFVNKFIRILFIFEIIYRNRTKRHVWAKSTKTI